MLHSASSSLSPYFLPENIFLLSVSFRPFVYISSLILLSRPIAINSLPLPTARLLWCYLSATPPAERQQPRYHEFLSVFAIGYLSTVTYWSFSSDKYLLSYREAIQ